MRLINFRVNIELDLLYLILTTCKIMQNTQVNYIPRYISSACSQNYMIQDNEKQQTFLL